MTASVTNTATVGFFPASGKAGVSAGTAAPGKTATGDGPLGPFGALLQLVSSVTDSAASKGNKAQSAADIASGIAHQLANTGDDPTVDDASNADGDIPADLLADLSKLLDALGIASDTETPLDPALEEQGVALLEAIAAAVSVPLPVIKVAEAAAPTIAALGAAALDAANPRTGGMPAGSDEGAELPPLAKELADKLAKLAAALESKAPGLAERLAALGTKITSGELDLSALGALASGDAEDGPDAALLRLLAAAPDAKPANAPKPFTAASLDMPANLTPPGADPEGAANKLNGDADSGLRADTRPGAGTERPDGPPQRTHIPMTATAAAAAADPGTPPPQITATAAPGTAPTIVTADTKAMHAAYDVPVRQINIPQVAFEVTRQIQAGATRFQIRLDPPELGRIDVKLDMDAAGNVNAKMTVDRAETLDLMQRDHRALERALAQAGLDSSKTNLEFSLRQNPFAHQEGQQHQGDDRQNWSPLAAGTDPDAASLPPPHVIAYRGTASPGGVNLFV